MQKCNTVSMNSDEIWIFLVLLRFYAWFGQFWLLRWVKIGQIRPKTAKVPEIFIFHRSSCWLCYISAYTQVKTWEFASLYGRTVIQDNVLDNVHFHYQFIVIIGVSVIKGHLPSFFYQGRYLYKRQAILPIFRSHKWLWIGWNQDKIVNHFIRIFCHFNHLYYKHKVAQCFHRYLPLLFLSIQLIGLDFSNKLLPGRMKTTYLPFLSFSGRTNEMPSLSALSSSWDGSINYKRNNLLHLFVCLLLFFVCLFVCLFVTSVFLTEHW